MKYLISVIIPAYNEEKLIKRCIEAVADQNFDKSNYEIIVIDNNSTDDTAEIAKRSGAKVVVYKEKQGFSFAKQFGTTVANGDIIAFTDADSFPEKNWLNQISQLMQNKELACVGGTILSSDKNFITNLPFVIFDLVAQINQFFRISLIWSPNMAVRRDEFMAIGGFNTNIKTSDDWELVLRFQKKFGKRCTLYTTKLKVRTNPRKQEKLRLFLPYIIVGFLNYILLFMFRKSITLGTHKNVR